MVMMIVLIVVLVALNMTITTWWQRCWWQWQEWVLNRPNLTGAVLPAHMWPRGFSLSTFAILSLFLIELASMWYFCKLPPVFTEELSDGKIFVAIVFFFQNDAITMFFWHTPPLLLIWLFGLNHLRPCFSMLCFFPHNFWLVFMLFQDIFMVFHGLWSVFLGCQGIFKVVPGFSLV